MFGQRNAVLCKAASSLLVRPYVLYRTSNRLQSQLQRLIGGCGVNGGHTRKRTAESLWSRATIMPLCSVLLPVTMVFCDGATRTFSGKTSADDFENEGAGEDGKQTPPTIYEFTVKDTHGNDVSLEKYKGQVLLIVNIASKCGLTSNHYKKLTQLKEKYGERGLTILNFPCNQFGGQMPVENGEPMVCHLRDSKADIGELFEKIEVNGANAHPLYTYLKARQPGMMGNAIKWNFTKFLVNREGHPVERYAPTTDPMDVAKDIEKLL